MAHRFVTKYDAEPLHPLVIGGTVPNYDTFLEERRRLMALKIQQWFEAL